MEGVKPIYVDELPEPEALLFRALKTRIQLEEGRGQKSVKTIYIRQDAHPVFMSMVNRINERLAKANMPLMGEDGKYIFMKVEIQKAPIIQFELISCDYWAKGGKALTRQRESLKMEHLNN